MKTRLLLGLPALVLATSCVPHMRSATVQAAPRVVTDDRALLRQLALAVPDDVASHPALSPVTAPRATTSLPGAAPAFDLGPIAADDAQRAADCLTAAVYYEARSESADGQRAVAQVVLNRVRDRAFPDSVCGVVYQGSTRRTGCQFSFTCDGSMNHPRDWASWRRAEAIAADALAGAVYAPVGSATYYHADYVLPWWAPSLTRIGAVGAHIFYRWRDRLENALAFRQRYAGTEPVPAAAGAGGQDIAFTAAGVHGVTVHRGGDVTPAAAVSPAVAAPPRPASVAGVRIHVGLPAPEDQTPDGVLISSESDAI